jgi:transcriptional regulator with XRE-family HTH domain
MPPSEAQAIQRKIRGVLLRQARTDAGKTLKECGEILGLSSSTVSAVEYGRRSFSLPELELLAYYLEVPLEHLLNDKVEAVNSSPKKIPGTENLALRHRIIGALLRQARQDQDLNQAELAKKIGITSGLLSRYELGQTPVPLEELEALSQALNLPLSHFLDEGIGSVGNQQRLEREWRQFLELPHEIRDFVLDSVNQNHIRLAMHLSDTPAEQLRNIAASLLEITY